MSRAKETSSVPGSSLQQVLQEVLNEKINDLKIQKTTLESYYKRVIDEAAKKKNDPIARIKILYDGIKNSPVPQSTRKILDGLPLFLETAADDPSCSTQIFNHWVQVLETEISFARNKCEYSYIFGKIMQDGCRDDVTSSKTESSVATPSAQREKTIKDLEERVFAEAPFDEDAFRKFLTAELLNTEHIEVHEVLKTVREAIKRESENLLEHTFSEEDMVSCVDGLLATDLLNEEKKTTLLWLKENRTSLREVASLLTNRLKKLKEWQWSAQGVYVDVRRSMNGRYRAFLDEDIPTALFLQFVGVRFCVLFRENLFTIYHSRIWKRNSSHKSFVSIENVRYDRHSKNFLSLLPGDGSKQATSPYEDKEDRDEEAVKSTDVKNSLLHMLNTEARLHQVISPSDSFTVIRTDLEWFGPSIPHGAIHAMLEFFALPEIWRNFFRKFLQVPMFFKPGQKPQVRRRGVPISHPLSTLCGESLLFLMDLHVNQTSGVVVHRIHDDFWLWDKNEELVCTAWEAMQRFAKLSALKFNMEKSGSAKVLQQDEKAEIKRSEDPKSGDGRQDVWKKEARSSQDRNQEGESGPLVFGKEPLPQSPVRWGTIVFYSDAVFRIDYDAIRPHIEEERRLLKSARTVVGWVTVCNRYTGFFMRGFGKFAKVFGVQHLDQMSRAMMWIQSRVFEEHGGNPLAALKSQFDVFGDVDILDMWAYWPLVAGGLGLKNVYMEIAPLKESLLDENGQPKEEETFFARLPERDHILWEEAEKQKREAKEGKYDDEGDGDFRFGLHRSLKPESFESYCLNRETRHEHWQVEYLRAVTVPEPNSMLSHVAGSDVWSELGTVELGVKEREYALRLVLYYGNQLRTQFGTLQFINPELIPMSMVDSFKSADIQWEE